jgi:hypothetical protein
VKRSSLERIDQLLAKHSPTCVRLDENLPDDALRQFAELVFEVIALRTELNAALDGKRPTRANVDWFLAQYSECVLRDGAEPPPDL